MTKSHQAVAIFERPHGASFKGHTMEKNAIMKLPVL